MKDSTLIRNREFTRRCIELYKRDISQGAVPTIDNLIDRVTLMQPHAYYIAYDTAAGRIYEIKKYGMEKVVSSAVARKMWQEMIDAVEQTMATRGCMSFDKALSFVLNFRRTSRFYISRDTARRILTKHFIPTIALRQGAANRC